MLAPESLLSAQASSLSDISESSRAPQPSEQPHPRRTPEASELPHPRQLTSHSSTRTCPQGETPAPNFRGLSQTPLHLEIVLLPKNLPGRKARAPESTPHVQRRALVRSETVSAQNIFSLSRTPPNPATMVSPITLPPQTSDQSDDDKRFYPTRQSVWGLCY